MQDEIYIIEGYITRVIQCEMPILWYLISKLYTYCLAKKNCILIIC